MAVGGRNLNTTHGGGESEEGEHECLPACEFDDGKNRHCCVVSRLRLRGFPVRARLLFSPSCSSLHRQVT